MPKPLKEVQEKRYYKDIYFLYEIISRLKNREEIKNFLKDMLTSSELRMFKRRWHIACALEADIPIRRVAKITETSTATVLKVAEKLENGHGGLTNALDRTRREREKRKEAKSGVSATFGYYHYLKSK